MPNIKSIIASHNSKLLTQPANIPQQTTSTQTNASNPEPKECNCRGGTNICPNSYERQVPNEIISLPC